MQLYVAGEFGAAGTHEVTAGPSEVVREKRSVSETETQRVACAVRPTGIALLCSWGQTAVFLKEGTGSPSRFNPNCTEVPCSMNYNTHGGTVFPAHFSIADNILVLARPVLVSLLG